MSICLLSLSCVSLTDGQRRRCYLGNSGGLESHEALESPLASPKTSVIIEKETANRLNRTPCPCHTREAEVRLLCSSHPRE